MLVHFHAFEEASSLHTAAHWKELLPGGFYAISSEVLVERRYFVDLFPDRLAAWRLKQSIPAQLPVLVFLMNGLFNTVTARLAPPAGFRRKVLRHVHNDVVCDVSYARRGDARRSSGC